MSFQISFVLCQTEWVKIIQCSSPTLNDSEAFLPHLLLTVWGLLFLSSSPHLPLLHSHSSLSLLLFSSALWPSRLQRARHPSHQNNILPHFFSSFPPISPQTCSLFSISCSFFLFSRTLAPPGGDPSPTADSHRPRPPHHTHTNAHACPIPPLPLVLSVLPHCSSTPPLSVSPPAAVKERDGRRRTAEQSCSLNEGMILDRADKKGRIICLGSVEIKHDKAGESELGDYLLHSQQSVGGG